MDAEFVRKRITELRLKKGVSEYGMSLDLGHSRSYIQSIASGRSLPSLAELFYICGYFEISPKEFFDDGIAQPILVEKAIKGMRVLSDDDLSILINLIDRLRAGNG